MTSLPRFPRLREDRWLPYALVAPSLLAIALILIYPIAKAVVMSLYRIELTLPGGDAFVGLENYKRLITSPVFLDSLWRSFVYTAAVTLLTYLVGLGVALLLNRETRYRAVARTLVILPWAVPSVVAALSWSRLLDFQYGLLNFVVLKLGLVSSPQGWLIEPTLAIASVIAITTWKLAPIPIITLLAALQGIPQEYYEAAEIDGARRFAKLVHVTLPGIRSVSTGLFLLLTIWTFRYFTIIYVATEGGPARATETLPIQTYLQAFRYFSLGDAATVGVITLVISMAFSMGYLRVTKQGAETS